MIISLVNLPSLKKKLPSLRITKTERERKKRKKKQKRWDWDACGLAIT